MTAPQFSPERSTAIRSLILEEIEGARASITPSRRWGTKGIAAFIVVGAVTGGIVSAAASDIFWPDPGPGGLGAPIVSVLEDGFTATGTGSEEIPIPKASAGATHLQVIFTCGSGGSFTWGTDPVNNPGSSCSAAEIGSRQVSASYDFPLSADTTTFFINTGSENSWQISARFLGKQPTTYGTNANGETYGVAGEGAEQPDLIATSGTDPDGQPVEGYARWAELNAFSPDHPSLPSNPDEALEWQLERDQKYPHGWDIPIYSSDGATQIGVQHVG